MATTEQRLLELAQQVGTDIKGRVVEGGVDFILNYRAARGEPATPIPGGTSGSTTLPDVDFVADIDEIINA